MKGDVELVRPDGTVVQSTRIGDMVRVDESAVVMTVCMDLGHELLLHNLEACSYPRPMLFQDPDNPLFGWPETPLQ